MLKYIIMRLSLRFCFKFGFLSSKYLQSLVAKIAKPLGKGVGIFLRGL